MYINSTLPDEFGADFLPFFMHLVLRLDRNYVLGNQFLPRGPVAKETGKTVLPRDLGCQTSCGWRRE